MDYGFPDEIIEQIEAELEIFDTQSVIARLDQIFKKGWSYEYDGPDLIDIPVEVPKNPAAKNPQAFKIELRPHWRCRVSIDIMMPEHGVAASRDYTLTMPALEGGFEVARDLALIYAAYYGWGLGKRSGQVFENDEPVVQFVPHPPDEDWKAAKAELQDLKQRLGLKRNADLDQYVREWSEGSLTTHQEISKANVRAFTDYLKEKIDGREPPQKD